MIKGKSNSRLGKVNSNSQRMSRVRMRNKPKPGSQTTKIGKKPIKRPWKAPTRSRKKTVRPSSNG